MKENEKSLYFTIKQKFVELFKSKGCEIYLEITANKKFSNKLKSKIPDYRQIIFYFLRDIAPDITGFVCKDNFIDFIIIEVKNEPIKLDHIYQARKYAELFEAKFAFLISTEELSEEIKRLSKVVYSLLSLPTYRTLTIVQFNRKTRSLNNWYPENPFEKEYYWR